VPRLVVLLIAILRTETHRNRTQDQPENLMSVLAGNSELPCSIVLTDFFSFLLDHVVQVDITLTKMQENK
jgi:hypothetical protein